MQPALYRAPSSGAPLILPQGARPRATLSAVPRIALAPSPVDPYATIEKVPLVVEGDGMKSKGFSVRLADSRADTGWQEVGVVSENYLLIPNHEVRDLAFDVCARAGGEWTLSREFFDGKRYALALVLRDRALVEVKVGDTVGIGLVLFNSYDGSTRLSASVFVNRLVCTNGMLAPKLFRRVTFKHTDAARGWEAGTLQALDLIRHAPTGIARFAESARRLAALNITSDELSLIRSQVLPGLPVSLWGKVVDRLLLHEEHTGWGLMNAGTRVLWHASKPTSSDLQHNEAFVRGLLDYVG